MEFEPTVQRVQAVPVTLEGADLMVFSLGGRAHVADRDLFNLLLRPVMNDVKVDVHLDVSLPSVKKMAELVKEIDRRSARPNLAEIEKQTRRRTTSIKPIEPLGAAKGNSDLSSYPKKLQFPLASSRRQVWDALEDPRTLDEIQEWTAMTNQAVYAALTGMRNDALVHKRDSDGRWERTREEEL